MDQRIKCLEEAKNSQQASINELGLKLEAINENLAKLLKNSEKSVSQSQSNIGPENIGDEGPNIIGTGTQAGNQASLSTVNKVDPQASFTSIKAAVQSLRIPPELTLAPTPFRKGDSQTSTIINRTARTIETVFKLLSSESTDPYPDIFTCMLALLEFLREEQAALVVQNTFDPQVTKIFRSLRRGGGFSAAALEDLRSAAAISAAYRPSQPTRGRGYPARGAFNFRGRGGDFFQRAAGRGFPSQRGQAHHRQQSGGDDE